MVCDESVNTDSQLSLLGVHAGVAGVPPALASQWRAFERRGASGSGAAPRVTPPERCAFTHDTARVGWYTSLGNGLS
jgi:hypothetical protein